MSRRVGLLFVFVLFFCSVIAVKAPPKPTIPSQYLVYAIYTIPYFNITEPIKMLYDAQNNRQRWEYYNGMDTFINLYGQGASYQITPAVNKMICSKQPADSSAPVSLIPDVSGSAWTYQGIVSIKNVLAHNWEMTEDHNGRTERYNFYSDVAFNLPVQFHMAGVDIIFGSHPDIYVIDYLSYIPNFQNASAFTLPSLCSNAELKDNVKHSHSQYMNIITKAVGADNTHVNFQRFAQKYSKKYTTQDEYLNRKLAFAKNQASIKANNQLETKSFTMKMNHFGDLTDEEFINVMLPLKRRRLMELRKFKNDQSSSESSSAEIDLAVDTKKFPSSVDWRVKGAVTPIKDQGMCGSCWTFGTAGSVEGVYAAVTGKLISLSEQQLVDCAWSPYGGPGGNQGCNGGFASSAMQWIIDNGGMATESSYPYLAQNAWCNAKDNSSGIKIRSYVNVTVGESYLLEAVANVGPIAVAIDASHDSFRFYASGVYYEPSCSSKVDDLDHEVLVVGYGTVNNQDYWIVKNSWSPHWGDDGYALMSRNRGNNCGIATQATYPVIF